VYNPFDRMHQCGQKGGNKVIRSWRIKEGWRLVKIPFEKRGKKISSGALQRLSMD